MGILWIYLPSFTKPSLISNKTKLQCFILLSVLIKDGNIQYLRRVNFPMQITEKCKKDFTKLLYYKYVKIVNAKSTIKIYNLIDTFSSTIGKMTAHKTKPSSMPIACLVECVQFLWEASSCEQIINCYIVGCMLHFLSTIFYE